MKKKAFQQDAYRPLANRMFWPPDVSTGWGVPQVNKFELISSDGHQMSLAGDGVMGIPSLMMSRGGARAMGVPCLMSGEEGGWAIDTSAVMFNASWLMVPREPPMNRQTDMRENITFRNFIAGGKQWRIWGGTLGMPPTAQNFLNFLETFTKSYVSTLLEGRRPRLQGIRIRPWWRNWHCTVTFYCSTFNVVVFHRWLTCIKPLSKPDLTSHSEIPITAPRGKSTATTLTNVPSSFTRVNWPQ